MIRLLFRETNYLLFARVFIYLFDFDRKNWFLKV